MTLLLLWILYLVTVVAVAAVAGRLRLPIPRPFLVAFALLPVLLMLPPFTSEKTPVPVDHALAIPPWSLAHPGVSRYNPNLNDITMQFVPWAKAVRMAFKEGALPMRNRWNGAGMVLAGNSQSGAFYPPLLLGGLLPLAAAFSLVAAIKTFLALTGTWLWLRELRLSSGAALFGAVSFSLSLTITGWLFFPHTAVISLWPWALLSIELLRREDGRAGFWTATGVLTVWALGGHPESAASGAAFAFVWLIARAALRDLPDWRRFGRRLIAAAGAATGLSAFLLFPSILAILASNRLGFWTVFWQPHLSLVPHRPIWHPGGLALFFPRIFGDRISSPMIEAGMASYPEMGLGYIGIAGWAAAMLILRRGPERPPVERALIVPLIAGWACAVGLWPFAELLAFVPGLKLMFPVRFFSWVALAGSAIAAFEVDRLSEELRTRRAAARPAIFAAAALALAGIAAYRLVRPLHEAAGSLEAQREWMTLALIALGGFVLAVLTGGRGAFRLAATLTAINGAELYLQAQRIYRFGSPQDLFPPTPVVRWLASRPPPFRVVGDGATIFPNSNVFAGVEEVRTHDPVERSDYVRFLDATAGYPPAEYFKQLRDQDAAVLDFLNVRYFVRPPGQLRPGPRWEPVYSGPDAVVFENASVLPRVFVPAAIRLVSPGAPGTLPPSDALAPFDEVLPEMAALRDWRSVAFVGADGGSPGWREGAQPSAASIRDYRERTNGATFTVGNPTGRDLTLVASLVQDGGWSAETESGLSLPVAHANGPFLAVSVPPGEHRVRLRYVAPGSAAGAAVSGAAALLLAGVAWKSRRVPRREEPAP